jgi:hypothetical protein
MALIIGTLLQEHAGLVKKITTPIREASVSIAKSEDVRVNPREYT